MVCIDITYEKRAFLFSPSAGLPGETARCLHIMFTLTVTTYRGERKSGW